MAYTRIQRLIGTTSEWDSYNPVLLDGEAGYEKTTTGEWKVKLGDGKSTWGALPYAINFSGNLADIQEKLDAALAAQTAAKTAETNAETAKTAAETARDAASSSKTAAATSESNAASSAAAANTSAGNASASATAASTSASNASSSASAAASSASAAASSASASDAAKAAAASSASAAATSEANAASSAQAAANSAASLVVVNDLVTGGTSNALSAEQGKVLSTSISTLTADTQFPFTNLVINGDFSNGTTAWATSASSSSASNNVLTNTGDGTTIFPQASQYINYISGHVYYGKAKFMVTNSVCANARVRFADGYKDFLVSAPTANLWYSFSDVFTTKTGGSLINYVAHRYTDAATANGKVMQVQYVLAVDLTAAFGAGNEPTAAEMDALLAQFPNSWFDGTITLTQKQILVWTLNLIRKNTNAIVALGGTIV